ncbi:MAG TPA: hypothetical protein VL793_01600 [Patescibacteria group bacterium]|jgi:hypothetical protein|nr:hypothetical protein [Patescibacteria group bacterium]
MLAIEMRTLLRHTETGLYFQGPEKWTANPENGCDFRFIDRARQFVRVWELEKVEVAFSFEDSQSVCSVSVAEEIKDAA